MNNALLITTKIFILVVINSLSSSAQSLLESYVSEFSYETRKEMKVSSKQMVDLLKEDEAILLDIRFKEEQAAWQFNYAKSIPIPLLPQKHTDLPKNKLIVTACPHKDRAIIAMVYLKTKGYNVAYLKDGLLGLSEFLRGDKAKSFIETIED